MYAYDYSMCFATEENTMKKFRYFFVNSVPNPEMCILDSQFQTEVISFEDYLNKEPSVKTYSNSLNKVFTTEESQIDLHDSYERKIINGSFISSINKR